MRLLIDTLKDVVVIPTGAVQRGPNGTFVYVVKRRQHAPRCGRSRCEQQDETQAVIKSGVDAAASAWSPPALRGSPTAAKVAIGSANGAPAAPRGRGSARPQRRRGNRNANPQQ